VSDSFDDLKQTLATNGTSAAIDLLCQDLKDKKDFTGLFYALLMKKRLELGVSPIPTGPAQDLPQSVHGQYEETVRDSARVAGRLYLDDGNIPGAWAFFRMIGEPAPVREALEAAKPATGDDFAALIDIAFHQGVHPTKGFDWVLEHNGICNAITMVSSQNGNQDPAAREYCIKRLVRALHADLVQNLAAHIERVQNFRPSSSDIYELLTGRDWLFAEDSYHIDVSHLSSVVQLSMNLPVSAELELARQLCEYGSRLSPSLQLTADWPFEHHFKDYAIYLSILAEDNIEEGLAHFRDKVESANVEEMGTFAAEVFVNLLTRVGRDKEALAVARRYLAKADGRRLSCPGIVELCEKTGDYQTLAEVAREQNNAVHFLAALLAGKAI
jgi:hypothetical protein